MIYFTAQHYSDLDDSYNRFFHFLFELTISLKQPLN